MRKIIKVIILAAIILALFLFAFQKDYERKRLVIRMDEIHNDYVKYRDSTELVIDSYKDSLRVIRNQKEE